MCTVGSELCEARPALGRCTVCVLCHSHTDTALLSRSHLYIHVAMCLCLAKTKPCYTMRDGVLGDRAGDMGRVPASSDRALTSLFVQYDRRKRSSCFRREPVALRMSTRRGTSVDPGVRGVRGVRPGLRGVRGVPRAGEPREGE